MAVPFFFTKEQTKQQKAAFACLYHTDFVTLQVNCNHILDTAK